MIPLSIAENPIPIPISASGEPQGAQLRFKLAPDPIDTVALFGLPISNVTMQQAVDRVDKAIQSGHVQQIATANLDFARNSLRDPYLHRIICECNMVLPDGAPMLWASRIFRAPLVERVTGVDLIPRLAELSQQKGYGIFFLGSSEESSQRASAVLMERYPGAHIIGRYCPPMATLQEMNHEEIVARIRAARPDIVFVGFGNPKQELWIHRHKDRLPAAVYIGIGGSLDMISGKLRRAPRWIQKLQLEWFYRMSQEPFRLLPRYVHDAAALIAHLPMGFAANRMQPFERRQRGSAVDIRHGFRVFATPGKVGGRASSLLVKEAKAASAAGENLIIDLSATVRLEAEGLGGLLEARRIMLEEGHAIWLTSISNSVRRVLQFSAMADLFQVAISPAAAIQSTRSANSGIRLAYAEGIVGSPRPANSASEPVTIVVRAS